MKGLTCIRSFALAFLALSAASCTSTAQTSVETAVQKDLQHAKTLTGLAYQQAGADSPAGADMRGVYCAVSDALRRLSVDGGTDEAGITCKR